MMYTNFNVNYNYEGTQELFRELSCDRSIAKGYKNIYFCGYSTIARKIIDDK